MRNCWMLRRQLLITSCGVSWHSQKVWKVHSTTSPNWHLANSAHHCTAVFQVPTAIANRAKGHQHKPFCCHEIKKQSQQRSIAGYGFWNTTETNWKHSTSAAKLSKQNSQPISWARYRQLAIGRAHNGQFSANKTHGKLQLLDKFSKGDM